jgi:hypothetical protein
MVVLMGEAREIPPLDWIGIDLASGHLWSPLTHTSSFDDASEDVEEGDGVWESLASRMEGCVAMRLLLLSWLPLYPDEPFVPVMDSAGCFLPDDGLVRTEASQSSIRGLGGTLLGEGCRGGDSTIK